MNTILQKRIDTRAAGIGLEFRDAIVMQGINRDTAEAVATLTQTAAQVMAEWLLEHMWISVEEALPKEKYLVLTRVKTPVGIVHRSDYYINDYWYMCRYNQEEIVTHWALIPSLKGGE